MTGKKELTKVKYNNIIYSVGDVVEVMMYGYPNNSLAEITRVVLGQELNKDSFWPMVKVKWYYSKNDLVNEGALKEADFISNYEVFSSTHQDPIFVETIVKKVKVIPFSEYEKLTNFNEFSEDLYFTRATYDIAKVSYNITFLRKLSILQLLNGKRSVCVSHPTIQTNFTFNAVNVSCGTTQDATI